MKPLLLISCFLLACLSCRKSANTIIKATVIVKAGPGDNTYIADIEESGSNRPPFLCNPEVVPAARSCAGSVYIINLPSELRKEGLKIQFTRYKDKGINPIWSYSFAPHDIEVYDAVKR